MIIEATGSSPAGIITACATVLIATGGLVGALTLFIPILRNVKQVHEIVNQQRTDMQRYQAVLVHALKQADIEIPVDQSLPIPPDHPPTGSP